MDVGLNAIESDAEVERIGEIEIVISLDRSLEVIYLS
jgi:hypothetical protein